MPSKFRLSLGLPKQISLSLFSFIRLRNAEFSEQYFMALNSSMKPFLFSNPRSAENNIVTESGAKPNFFFASAFDIGINKSVSREFGIVSIRMFLKSLLSLTQLASQRLGVTIVRSAPENSSSLSFKTA